MITISVDDNINTAKEIVKIMKEVDPSGEHTPYMDAEAALTYVKDKLPDVAWLDIEMPGITGLEFAKRIKEISPKTNIIFVTGHEKFASYIVNPLFVIFQGVQSVHTSSNRANSDEQSLYLVPNS